MIKKMIVEFPVKNSQEALAFYKNVFKIEVINSVMSNSPGTPTNLHHLKNTKETVINDSLLKINNDYFKIYEWNSEFDGPYDEKIIRNFNLNLQFSAQNDTQELWDKFKKDNRTKEIIKLGKVTVGDFWFFYGVIEDPFKIRWTFIYHPNTNEII